MPIFKTRRGPLVAIVTLVLIGAGLILARRVSMAQGSAPAGDEFWRLHLEVAFDAPDAGARLSLPYPLETGFAQAIAFHIDPHQLRYRTRRATRKESAVLEFESYAAGSGSVACWFDIHLRQAPWALAGHRQSPSMELQAAMLKNEPDIDVKSIVVEEAARRFKVRSGGKRSLLDAIHDYCVNELTTDSDGGTLPSIVLTERRGSELGIARTMVALCQSLNISARVIRGYRLEQPLGNESLEAAAAVEAWFDGAWRSFDPTKGHRDHLPRNFLPMRVTSGPIAQSTSGTVSVRASLERRPAPAGVLGADDSSLWRILDLTRMPLEIQTMFVHLLVLPFGALLVTTSRNLLGVRSFGVFSPALMAMSLLYVDVTTAAIVFAVTVCVGVAGRALLPGLKLMRMPRLSVVFTMVAVVITICLSTMAHLGTTPAGQLVLLPTVVLTTIIDRFYTVADEDSTNIAMRRLGWTLLLTAGCAWIFQWPLPGWIVLHYPEVHLFTVAALILVGLYGGRQLCEVRGFLLLAEPKVKQSDSDSEEMPVEAPAAREEETP